MNEETVYASNDNHEIRKGLYVIPIYLPYTCVRLPTSMNFWPSRQTRLTSSSSLTIFVETRKRNDLYSPK